MFVFFVFSILLHSWISCKDKGNTILISCFYLLSFGFFILFRFCFVFVFDNINNKSSTACKRSFDDHDILDDNVSQPLRKRRKIMNANELISNPMNSQLIHNNDNSITNSTKDTNNTINTDKNNETKQQASTKKEYVVALVFCLFVGSCK